MSGQEALTGSRWALLGTGRRQSLTDALRDVLTDADLKIEVQLWHRPFDPFVKGAPWWQWRTPCDCPDTSFGRQPHHWDCALTPLWASTSFLLDINPRTVVTNAIRPIPQIEAWRRSRAIYAAAIDYAIALTITSSVGMIGLITGIDAVDWTAADAAEARLNQAWHDAHPFTLASEWGAPTELDYYGGCPMSNLVPSSEIEDKVGVKRHPYVHYARAVSAEQTVYILHSQSCLDSGIDLRACRYSLALDRGIDERVWAGREDVLVVVAVPRQQLEPLSDTAAAKLLAVSERIDLSS